MSQCFKQPLLQASGRSSPLPNLQSQLRLSNCPLLGKFASLLPYSPSSDISDTERRAGFLGPLTTWSQPPESHRAEVGLRPVWAPGRAALGCLHSSLVLSLPRATHSLAGVSRGCRGEGGKRHVQCQSLLHSREVRRLGSSLQPLAMALGKLPRPACLSFSI